MVNTKYNATEDVITKLQEIKGRTNLKFYQNVSNYVDEKNKLEGKLILFHLEKILFLKMQKVLLKFIMKYY